MSDTTSYRYCYIHGFGSGPKSKKGVILAEYMKMNGLELLLPDCNSPSFTDLTITNALGVIDKMDAQQRANNSNGKKFVHAIGS